MHKFNLTLEAQSKIVNSAIGLISFFVFLVLCYATLCESYVVQLRLAGQHTMALWFLIKCMVGMIITLIITVKLINVSTDLERKIKEQQRLTY